MRQYSVTVNKQLQKEIARTAVNIHRDARTTVARKRNRHGGQINDTGALLSGIRMVVQRLAGTVWSSADYSIDVEKGQAPGRYPNTNELKGWVKRKLGVSKKRLGSVTLLVARKIYKEGTDAQPYFEPAVLRYKFKFFNNVRRIIKNGKGKF